jgi:hypothetical protein
VLAYFDTLSALIKVFFVLTILNIPIMMIYSSYETKTSSGLKSLTLGNLGQSEAICSIVKFGLNRNLIDCSTGLITSIESFGLLEAQTKTNSTKTFFDGLFYPKDKGRRCVN